MSTVKERFINYVKYDTASDEKSNKFPSTDTQIKFAEMLLNECIKIGLKDSKIDSHGYVTACLESNSSKNNLPTIGFIAHMDTSPETSGKNVKPNIIENYDGNEIKLKNISISPTEFPSLKNYIGQTIITSDGTTLLGADDKAGIAEILTAMEYLINHSEIQHGTIKIAFTPDEEIGKGTDYFDVKSFGADFAYTIDGGRIGEIEYENFNAARAVIKITGKSVHPGTAKSVMINASLLGNEIISSIPKNEVPSRTENYEGFYHLVSFNGTVSSAELVYIVRDFSKDGFEYRKSYIKDTVNNINKKYKNNVALEIHDEYYNMSEKINKNFHIVELAKKSMLDIGIKPLIQPTRGGTDGARLSFMGLPCPNIFTGGHNFHGPYEYIPLESMEKCVKLIVKICENAS